MTDTARVRGTPHEIALLAGGPRAAVTVAVVALHLRGAVEAGAPGTVRAVDNEAGRALPPLPEDGVPAESRVLHLESAVHRRLHEPCDVPEVARDPDVRWMLAELRVGLADDGMLGLPLLRPTRAARRRLHVLRTACPVPASRAGLSDEAKLLAVALHGEAALRVLVPRFALRAGLVERVRLRRRRPLRLSSRHHGNGGGYTGHLYCGGGGGCGSGCGGGCGGGGGP
ncbi:TIGR04222 domain-containing membrane protein [Streptomyces sp. DH-12]|uniref:TIGR04222 domain-containing membrane protein n=1 Tax=unclassified Streptomyces TaxID=2593676 RepID=UPI000CCE7970|nr:TIGR04222 domain-containing membrane protein [Streptomyces sp. DH-12]PNV32032.1 TIGR04222 domain-containing membrane protein [Streptomyces sp. DH-12]